MTMTGEPASKAASAEVSISDMKMVGRECIGMRAQMASRAITRTFDKALKPAGLRLGQFTVLMFIKSGMGVSVSKLSESLAVERTTLTRNLTLLERDGLVVISPEGAQRVRSISITDEGERRLSKALPRWRKVQDALQATVDENSWVTTKSDLERLARFDA